MSDHRSKRLLSAFTAQREAITRFLVRRLGNLPLAEDLTQEVWIKAATAGGTGAVDNPRSYLFRIASNLAVDHQRHVAHQVEVQASDEVVATVADPLPSPEIVALHRSEFARLMRVVDGLSPRCREVFILAKFEELTYGEVAARLGISRNTVLTHMVTALAALEREMGPENKSEEPSRYFRSRPS